MPQPLRILSVFGTRPEAIKMAPVLKTLQAQRGRVVSRVCVTGQQERLLYQALELFGIRPDYDLKIMRASQTLGYITRRILERLEPILIKEQPDWVIVQGDTTSAMAASLAAFYRRIRVAHVEAGLRTRNTREPFPEELNRRIADLTAEVHFAPTAAAKRNLIQEGVPPRRIIVTGNTVIDALLEVSRRAHSMDDGPLAVALPRGTPLILVTAHRRENFGRPLEHICRALIELARWYDGGVEIVYPVHRNPNVWVPVHARLRKIPHITLLPPLDYGAFVRLMRASDLILTDSGGLQEEAPSLGKPVLVLRNVTERPEAVAAGTVKVIGTSWRRVVQETRRLLEDPQAYRRMARRRNPYGNGTANQRIVRTLLGWERRPEA